MVMSAGRATPACVPTWRGHIETTKDALIIFEAALSGMLAHCIRRPHDRERNSLIVSGNVFVYEEGTSGIKRWTDGIPWSPSRILTNFLIYRQLNSPFPPGEKKRATKRSQRPVKPGEPYATPGSKAGTTEDSFSVPGASPTAPGLKSEEGADKDADRVLVGSLVDSYEFKEGGLLKKTMTVTVNGVQHHLVSYYSLEDAKYHLSTPREDPRLKDIPLREELLNQPKFKVQNFDDAGDGSFDQADGQQTSYPYITSGYQTVRPFSTPTSGLPTPSHSQFPHPDQASPLYYGGYPQYNHVQNPTSVSSVSYTSMSNTPSYAPLSSTSTAYPQYPQQAQQQPQHQPHSHTQNHSLVKLEGQSLLQQHQPTIHTQSQFGPGQAAHPISPVEQQQFQHPSFQPSPSDSVSRRNGLMNMYSNSHDGLGLSTGYYSHNANVSSPIHDSSVLLPQPMQMQYPTGYGTGADGTYYTSRAAS